MTNRCWTRRPRLCLAGDHSGYHAGCDAVARTLRRLATQQGWRVVSEKADYDALLVNGEGSMHHGGRRFHQKMRLLQAAVDAGRPAFLVNSVWQENPSDYDRVLSRLSGIVVREVLSQRDLAERHGVRAEVCPDVSFFDELPRFTWARNFRGAAATTDFFLEDKRVNGVRHVFGRRDELFPDARPLPFIDWSWGRVVASLRTASHLITGRHHAVYAACVAGVPFIASEGNTHKIRGIVASAGADLQVPDTPAELPAITAANLARREEYDRVFAWMRSHDVSRIMPTPSILG